MLKKVKVVAYTLDLPITSRIHPTSHVSQLKKKIGSTAVAISSLPSIDDHGILRLQQEEVLRRKMVKVENRAWVELLVKWHSQDDNNATWKGYSKLKETFPHLEGNFF